MLNRFFELAGNTWNRMSKRERYLALAVAGLFALIGLRSVALGALERVDGLEDTIDRLQQDIRNYRHQIARKQIVERQYERVAAQHSSEWTEAEIYERLRQEVYRLAQNAPPPLDEDGIPVKTVTESGKLVEIPSLDKGILSESGEGFREYKIELKLPKHDLDSVISFLERLQDSPQSLRIDALDLTRRELYSSISADITITRIIVDSADEEARDEEEGLALAVRQQLPLQVDDWTTRAGELSLAEQFSTTGGQTLQFVAEKEGAAFWMPRNLPANTTYELAMDITSFGEGRLGIVDETGQEIVEGAPALKGEGKPHRYHVNFTLPTASGRQRVGVPAVILNSPGDRVYIDNVVMAARGS